MKLTFLLGLIWVAYVYGGYPILLACLSCWRRVSPIIDNSYSPSVSVLIAAHNEEKDIGWKLAETLAWDYPPEQLEILVVSDASEDATDTIVGQYTGERVSLTRMERRGGKARGLNRLARQAKGELLFFTDANAHVQRNALRLIARYFADPRVGCVTGDSQPIKEKNAPIADGAAIYWSYESILKQLENRLGSVLVCDGALFCQRANLFQSLDPELANDLESPMHVGVAGYWIMHERSALAFERDTRSPLEEFKRRQRMCAQGMLAMLRLRSTYRGLRGWQFISHKLLRWLTLLPLLMMLLSSAVLSARSPIFAVLCAAQAIFYVSAGIGFIGTITHRRVLWIFIPPFYTLLGLLGALIGVIKCLAGKRFDIWEIPSLSRGGIDAVFGVEHDNFG